MQETRGEATIEAEIVPTNLEINWSREQVSVMYDGEVSVIPLGAGYSITQEDRWHISDSHNEEILDNVVRIFRSHCRKHDIGEGI